MSKFVDGLVELSQPPAQGPVVTDRAVRERLRRAVTEAGGQKAWCQAVGLHAYGDLSALSKSLRPNARVRSRFLPALGLRMDAHGYVREAPQPSVSVVARSDDDGRLLAVHAEGEAGVAAAVQIVSAVLGRRS
ncbi:hypothetical protein [Methylobacterium sp. J-076]|uniref:hypothetical protein n=1 Tax=Methylobacterium sp. J-076 TaxID=2836655 RepID=UPI001FBB6DEB|nr:hypothetical protein [Methylobacterium sp. J-076]MCJ2015582.1 hypothetical protein [Methylobacterium sp. J-076]